VKEFLKSVNIWRRYGQKYGGMFFFDSQCSYFSFLWKVIGPREGEGLGSRAGKNLCFYRNFFRFLRFFGLNV